MKTCVKCLTKKSLDDFYVYKGRVGSWCKECVKKQTRERFVLLRKRKNQEINYLENEEFKEFLPNYLISNYGRVYRKEHKNTIYLNSQFLSPSLLTIGYYKITINKKMYLIHRLVAKYFCKNENEKIKVQVNHKDSNRKNNYYENLEWVTQAENVSHATKKNRMARKLTPDQVEKIRLLQEEKTIEELSDLYNVSKTNIRYILNRKIWKHI